MHPVLEKTADLLKQTFRPTNPPSPKDLAEAQLHTQIPLGTSLRHDSYVLVAVPYPVFRELQELDLALDVGQLNPKVRVPQ